MSKSWDRLPACRFPCVFDRLEAYPTNQHGLFHSLGANYDILVPQTEATAYFSLSASLIASKSSWLFKSANRRCGPAPEAMCE